LCLATRRRSPTRTLTHFDPSGTEHFSIPPPCFILFFTGSTTQLRQESIETYLLILQLSPGSCILLLDLPVEMRQTILVWVHDFNRTAESPVDLMRIIFRNWMEKKIQYLAMIDAIIREGEGGVDNDSASTRWVHMHTGANDRQLQHGPIAGDDAAGPRR
jgi:hypothetical protein